MTYAYLTWEFMADTYPMKLQHLHNEVSHTTDNFPRYTSTCELHVALIFCTYMALS